MKYDSICEYEKYRSDNQFIPPLESNSYYDINTGIINVYTTLESKFRLYTDSGTINLGNDDFQIGENQYELFTVITGTKLIIDNKLTIIDAPFSVHGDVVFNSGSVLYLTKNATGVFYADSHIRIEDNVSIIVEDGCSLDVFGEVDIHINVIDQIINNANVIVDTAAFIKAFGIEGPDVENRIFSLTDYDSYLRTQFISQYTQGEQNTIYGRMGYVWRGGNTEINSTQIEIGTLYGECILGDFRLSILGKQESLVPDLQILVHSFVDPEATLMITDTYHDKLYHRPELYLGYIRGNVFTGGTCTVDGKIIVDGSSSKITIDKYSKLTINEGGLVEVKNNSNIICNSDPDEVALVINGTLIVDTIEQINSFNPNNIEFGPNGKVIILNNYPDDHKLLWTTPIGIHSTDLYRLFENRLNHIEYHIQSNTGIGIDEYYEFYARDMTDWYSGMRIEKAIHEGMIKWHKNGFIELNQSVTPWVDETSSLLHAARIFKSYGSYDGDKLQEVVNRLRYAGASDIIFRFIHGDTHHDVPLVLDDCTMYSIVNKPMTTHYILNVQNNDGELYLRNKVPNTNDSTIIQYTSRIVPVNVGDNEFTVEPSN